jgi:heat shock protein HslJ
LEGTNWVLTTGAGLGVPVAGTMASVQFNGGTASGNAGCNRYNAPYVLNGSTLTIGPQIATTAMACGPAETAVELVYLIRLPRVTSYSIAGDTLTLSDQNGTAILEFHASIGAKEIVGTWGAIAYYTGSAITSVVGGASLTATFESTTVSGNSGCNSFNGPVKINGSAIHVGPLFSTLMACSSPELSAQEHSYLAALQAATTFTVTGTRLELFRPGGLIAVTFDRS